ncbi:MAG: hypothetical protein EOP09_01805 [Proteobacteria bacterium]|nr:MAG: hypothetical protein EOP09_01805 [Pseudomonadota bacterium]
MMFIDLNERVRVAYKKLKQMVHFERHPLTLRRRLAEFEANGDFEERLAVVFKVAGSTEPHKEPEFKKWLDKIKFEVVPKSVDLPNRLDDELGSFVSNVTSATRYRISKVNYIFDGPVELHLIAVLWLMMEGALYDKTLSDHCMGTRLHSFVGRSDDHSAYLFKKYHELYAKWRDSGIEKAHELLSKDRQSVCLVGLDVQEYYYRIKIDWETLRDQIERPTHLVLYEEIFREQEIAGGRLFKCIEQICEAYREKLNPSLAITHPGLPTDATCLPIGLCSSPVIANWYLKVFDEAVLQKVRPAYYGRYVDDIFMVVAMAESPDEEDPINDFMEQVLEGAGILRKTEVQGGFELVSRPGLLLQKKKCVLQYFDAEHSTAGLDKFQKEIETNASNFALLLVDGDDSPVAQVAYELLYDGSVNKFRSVKAVAENRWELAAHLAKQTQLHLMTEGGATRDLKEDLFRFFKGRNAVDFWDLWERVLSFLVVTGDLAAAEEFKTSVLEEIGRIQFSGNGRKLRGSFKEISTAIRESLVAHLDLSMDLSIAIGGLESAQSYFGRYWRDSNLIRHHLVALPLLNYTNYQGNLAFPLDAKKLTIDEEKAKNSPRFVHFDECLGFVNSGCARRSSKDRIEQANKIYAMFHGGEFEEVSIELIQED